MNEIIKPGLILLIITTVVASLLGVVNAVTKLPIEENAAKSAKVAMAKVLPTVLNDEFGDKVEFEGGYYHEGFSSGQKTGYVLFVQSTGYGGAIEMFVGIGEDGKIAGLDIVKHSETPGLGANADSEEFTGKFIGKDGSFGLVKNGAGENQIDAITAATITSKAVEKGVKAAYSYYEENLKGGVQ